MLHIPVVALLATLHSAAVTVFGNTEKILAGNRYCCIKNRKINGASQAKHYACTEITGK